MASSSHVSRLFETEFHVRQTTFVMAVQNALLKALETSVSKFKFSLFPANTQTLLLYLREISFEIDFGRKDFLENTDDCLTKCQCYIAKL
jgi:hypothetical protein